MKITPRQITDAVLKSFDVEGNDRLKAALSAVVEHTHAAIAEIEPTHKEFLSAIDFLVSVGKFCDENRDEMILLSDGLGISAQIDVLTDRFNPTQTSTTGLGPFYIPDQMELENGSSILTSAVPGDPLFFEGWLTDVYGTPLEGLLIDTWQAHENGLYDLQEDDIPNMRACLKSDANGYFSFQGVKPNGYPLPSDGPVRSLMDKLKSEQMRPAHLHFFIHLPDGPPKITHLFFCR